MMVRYEIKRMSGEFEKDSIIQGCTIFDLEPEIMESFASKNEALKRLAEYHTTYRTFSAPDGMKYSVSEYCVAETAYDEDGEFVSSTIWDISPMPKID